MHDLIVRAIVASIAAIALAAAIIGGIIAATVIWIF